MDPFPSRSTLAPAIWNPVPRGCTAWEIELPLDSSSSTLLRFRKIPVDRHRLKRYVRWACLGGDPDRVTDVPFEKLVLSLKKDPSPAVFSWERNSMFLTGKYFTFGVRTTEDDEFHCIRTFETPMLYLTGERLVLSPDSDHGSYVLEPSTRYAVPRSTAYMLLTVNDTRFSVSRWPGNVCSNWGRCPTSRPLARADGLVDSDVFEYIREWRRSEAATVAAVNSMLDGWMAQQRPKDDDDRLLDEWVEGGGLEALTERAAEILEE